MAGRSTAGKITIYAVSVALVCISTSIIQIPIPLGYMHLGNTLILLCAVMFGPNVGLAAGGLGSALADLLTGFAYWSIPTLIIKGIMGAAIGYIANKDGQHAKMLTAKTAVGAVVGIVIMVVGYFIGGSILYGSIYTGALQIPGLTIEGVLGLALFYALGIALEKAGFYRLMRVWGNR